MNKIKDFEKSVELIALKIILAVYIILCLVIAGLNYGYAPKATSETASLITTFWHFYENWIKTLFIIICSFLTIRIVGKSNSTAMRKRNLIGFIVSALVIHIIAPSILNNNELYFFVMPLPWTNTALQLLYENSNFYLSRYPVWGAAGIATTLIFYTVMSIIVVIGTILFGRRFQCSTLCLFNGFAAEVFEPAIPLVGKRKRMNQKLLKFFDVLRWSFLIVSFFFTFYWVLFLLGVPIYDNVEIMGKIENYKYLLTELLMAMFFWVAFMGRGYCYYCPLGTVLALISKISGQKIKTDNSNCVKCNKCNLVCPMTIDIKANATEGIDVVNLRCVGCGHCIDACPTRNLSYTTMFLSKCNRKFL